MRATYQSWNAMNQRCHNPNNPGFRNYGARGITVCERWRISFVAFVSDMGEKPKKKTLERRNVNKGYFPANCYWADYFEQANNRRNNKHLTFCGLRLTQAQWAKRYGITQATLHHRLKNGWTVSQALLTPHRSKRGAHRIEVRFTRGELLKLKAQFKHSGRRYFSDWLKEKLCG